jgi:polyferredoxin
MPESIAAAAGAKGVARLKTWRRLTQAGFLLVIGQWSFYGIFRCPFVVPYVSCQNCPVITCHGRLMTMFWGFWLLLPLAALVFGRAFCGWACPGGLVNDLASLHAPIRLAARRGLARLLPWGKYLALAASIYIWLFMDQPRANIPLRVGDFFASVGLTFEHADPFWLVRSLTVLGLVALGIFVIKCWCRFVCPTGGALEALKGLALFRVYKTESCNGCDACLRVCNMATRPDEANCTNCCDCLSGCPQDAIRLGRKGGSR